MINHLHQPSSICRPFWILAAILKMAEFEVARNHFVICIIWRTYGVNFMLVSSTEVFPQICSLSSSAIYPKFLFKLLAFSLTVQPGLCQNWSEHQIVGFLTHRLKLKLMMHKQMNKMQEKYMTPAGTI